MKDQPVKIDKNKATYHIYMISFFYYFFQCNIEICLVDGTIQDIAAMIELFTLSFIRQKNFILTHFATTHCCDFQQKLIFSSSSDIYD